MGLKKLTFSKHQKSANIYYYSSKNSKFNRKLLMAFYIEKNVKQRKMFGFDIFIQNLFEKKILFAKNRKKNVKF